MFDPFSIGFLIGGLITGVTLSAIFGHVEVRRMKREIEESKNEIRLLRDECERKGGDDF